MSQSFTAAWCPWSSRLRSPCLNACDVLTSPRRTRWRPSMVGLAPVVLRPNQVVVENIEQVQQLVTQGSAEGATPVTHARLPDRAVAPKALRLSQIVLHRRNGTVPRRSSPPTAPWPTGSLTCGRRCATRRRPRSFGCRTSRPRRRLRSPCPTRPWPPRRRRGGGSGSGDAHRRGHRRGSGPGRAPAARRPGPPPTGDDDADPRRSRRRRRVGRRKSGPQPAPERAERRSHTTAANSVNAGDPRVQTTTPPSRRRWWLATTRKQCPVRLEPPTLGRVDLLGGHPRPRG